MDKKHMMYNHPSIYIAKSIREQPWFVKVILVCIVRLPCMPSPQVALFVYRETCNTILEHTVLPLTSMRMEEKWTNVENRQIPNFYLK